jgi:HTH-like domain
MKFALIDAAKTEFPVHRLCRVLDVSQSGYFAWKDRPACRRQHEDMVLLAHVRSAFALSNGTYGSARMTRELQDSGLVVGRRRTSRLMRENGLKAGRSGGSSGLRTAITPGWSRPTCSIRTSPRAGPMRNGFCRKVVFLT